MILSHRNKFIFMHSRKTAGSSITALLNRHLGPDDIQIGAWPDAIEAGGKYNRRALLIAMRSPLALGFESLKHSVKKRKPEIAPHFVNTVTRLHYANKHDFRAGAHISARQVAEFDPDSWSRYYKFCFVRNPWTHAVSDYHWRCRMRGVDAVPFKEFLTRLDDPSRPDPEKIKPPILTNWSIYAIDDEIAVDFVGRFERLEEDLGAISDRIGIKLPIRDASAKTNVKPKSKPIESYYDDENVELVRSVYSKEIRSFSYEPPF